MSPNADAPLTPLQICLCCGYSLAGLPDVHQCPECGLSYSPDSFAIEVKPEETTTKTAFVLVWLGIAIFMYTVGLGSGSSIRQITLPLFWIVFGAWYLFRGRFGRRLIIDSLGMHLTSRGRVLRSLSWDQLQSFYFSGIDGGLIARTTGGKRISLCRRNAKFAKECRKDIERVWDEYRKTVAAVRSGADVIGKTSPHPDPLPNS
jgi:hypothetical protein